MVNIYKKPEKGVVTGKILHTIISLTVFCIFILQLNNGGKNGDRIFVF